MSLFLIVYSVFVYVLGAYFFLLQKRYVGSSSLPLRALLFSTSPIMVPAVLYEIAADYVRDVKTRRVQ